MNPRAIRHSSDPAAGRSHPSALTGDKPVQSGEEISALRRPTVSSPGAGRIRAEFGRIEAATGRLVEYIGRALEGIGRKLEAAHSDSRAPASSRNRRNIPTAAPARVNNSFPESFAVAAVSMVSVLVFAAGVILSSAIVAFLGFIAVLCGAELYSRVLA